MNIMIGGPALKRMLKYKLNTNATHIFWLFFWGFRTKQQNNNIIMLGCFVMDIFYIN